MTEEQDRPVEGAPEDGSAQDQQAQQAPQGDAPAAAPSDRLATLEAEKNDARERMLRIAAEFDNYKKRVRKEQSESESKARESVIRDMLEVGDNLERAVAAGEGTDPKALQQGVQLVLRLFGNKLERYDVKPFEAKGQPFDPRLHDAISQIPTADAPPGSVVNEVQKGYKIGDRLLRPAMVSVAMAPPQAPPREASNGSGSDPGSDKP
jgi:molecular chaperone GrpE